MKLPIAQVAPSGIKNKPFVLTKPLKVSLSWGDKMYIPKGYWTDFASVPKVVRLFVDHIGQDSTAFVIHDYMYNFGGYKRDGRTKERAPSKVTRRVADAEMRYQMGLYGASKARQFTFYWAVRLFGWLRFKKI
jgi:hypothetical protein